MEEKKIKTTIFAHQELMPLTPGGHVRTHVQNANLKVIKDSKFDSVGVGGITIDGKGNIYFALPWTKVKNKHLWEITEKYGCLIKSEYNPILRKYEVEWTDNEIAKSLQQVIKKLGGKEAGEKKKEIKLSLHNHPSMISWDSIFNTDYYWKPGNHIYEGFRLLKEHLGKEDQGKEDQEIEIIINYGNDFMKRYAFFPLGDCTKSAVGRFTKMLKDIGFPGVEIFATFQGSYWLKLIMALQKETKYKGFVKGVNLRCHGWFPKHEQPPDPSDWVTEFEKERKKGIKETEKETEKKNLEELSVKGFINPGVWGFTREMDEGETEFHNYAMTPDEVKKWFKNIRKDKFGKPIEPAEHITGGFIWFYYCFNQSLAYGLDKYHDAIVKGLTPDGEMNKKL